MKEEELFTKALDQDPAERDAFLRDACGDDTALRKRVESILAAHEADGGMLDESLAPLEETATMAGPSVGEHKPRGGSFGDYELQGEIARGAMGVVYRAEQQSLKRTVAIKMIRSTLLASDRDVARFRAEAEAAASLDHPNIVPIYEIDESDGQHYYTMKLIEGGTLRDRLDDLKQDPKGAAKIMATVAGAVHAAHQRGILHRDLKPGNILVDEAGEPHVTDFGLAKQMESVSSMTLSGMLMGTPNYMAPEQAGGGGKELTTAVDIYALGVILYQLLCGTLPHQGTSLMETLKRVTEEDAVPPSRHHPKADRDLETIAMKCLEKNPDQRYASAQGLKNDLDRWLRGEPIEARPLGAAERLRKWMRRKPVHAAALGVSGLFLLTLGIGGPVTAYRQIELKVDAERARASESEARHAAETARKAAETAQKIAEARERELRRSLYVGQMNMASRAALEPGTTPGIQEMLRQWNVQSGREDLRGWEWYFLNGLAERRGVRWSNKYPEIRSLACSPDGETVALATPGGLRLCALQTGAERRAINLGKYIFSSSWDPRGNLIAIAATENPKGDRGQVLVYDIASDQVLRKLSKQESRSMYTHVSWSPDGARIMANDFIMKRIAVWDAESGEQVNSFAHSPRHGSSWGADGSSLLAGGIKGKNPSTLFRWSPNASGEESLGTFTGFLKGGFLQLRAGPNGRALGAIGWPDALVVLDLDGADAVVRHRLAGHKGQTLDMAWSPDGAFLATAGVDKTLRVWDAVSGDPFRVFSGHTDEVRLVAWPANGNTIVSADADGEVIAWDLQSKRFLTVLDQPDRPATTSRAKLAWSPDGQQLAAAADHWLRVYDCRPDSPILLYSEQNRPAHTRLTAPMTWSGPGRIQAKQGYGDLAKLVDLDVRSGNATPAPVAQDSRPLQLVNQSPDGRFLAVTQPAKWNPQLFVFDQQTGKKLFHAEDLINEATEPVWSADSSKLAYIARKGEAIDIIETGNFEMAHSLRTGPGLTCLRFSPDGARLAAGHGDRVRILDLASEELVAQLAGHSGQVKDLAWHPQGVRLASCGKDRTVRIWDPDSGTQVMQWAAFESSVARVAWAPDGSRLAALEVSARTTILDAWPGLLKDRSPRALPRLNQRLAENPNDLETLMVRSEIHKKAGLKEMAKADHAAAMEALDKRVTEMAGDAETVQMLRTFLTRETRRLYEEGWRMAAPETCVSEGGATLLPQPDHSILATGKNPDGDVYRVTLRPDLSRISAIRLEAIPDRSLPGGKPGRSRNGGIHLGNLSLTLHVPDRSPATALPLANAWANRAPGTAWNAVDDDPDLGWEVFPGRHENTIAIFEPAQPADLPDGASLTVRLHTGTRGGRDPKSNIGRFRISCSDHPKAARLAAWAEFLEDKAASLDHQALLGILHALRGQPKAAAEAFGQALDAADNTRTRARILEAAAGDPDVYRILWEARPSPSVSETPNLEHIAGAYQHTPLANNWLAGTIIVIQRDSSGRPTLLRWRNRAGKSWRLFPDPGSTSLLTCEDNPYFTSNPGNGRVFHLVTEPPAKDGEPPRITGFKFQADLFIRQKAERSAVDEKEPGR